MAEQVHSSLVYVYRERLRRADGSGYAQGAGMNDETKKGFVKIKMPTYYIAKYSYEDLRAAVLAEREACAQLCDEKALYFQYDFIAPYDVADSCAEEIRARGNEMKDGIALASIAHPEGDPVPDDHEIDPDSLETVELEIPMNERIKELAEQARFVVGVSANADRQIKHFAELVRQDEREACAKLCEEQYEYYGCDHICAAKIRGRTE